MSVTGSGWDRYVPFAHVRVTVLGTTAGTLSNSLANGGADSHFVLVVSRLACESVAATQRQRRIQLIDGLQFPSLGPKVERRNSRSHRNTSAYFAKR
jgi:hypothetical protein